MNRVAVALTVGIILVSLMVIFMVSQWDIPVQENVSPSAPTWVLLQPQKCQEIPWRKDWAISHGEPYASFPAAEEISILMAYYSQRGVKLLDVKLTYQAVDASCNACGCPEPFVFAFYVNGEDAARLTVSGFTILDKGNPYIFTGPFFRQSTTQTIALVTAKECEDVFSTNTFVDTLFGSKKDSCYIQAAISAKDVSLCSTISLAAAKNTCISEVAVATKDITLCEKIRSIESAYVSCVSGVAGILHQPSLCVRITEASAKSWCELGATPQ